MIDSFGSVEYLLTDKTGTLTKNQMTFENYVLKDDPVVCSVDRHGPCSSKDFLRCLLLCNSVTIEHGQYVALSPDEESLVIGCGRMGGKLLSRER